MAFNVFAVIPILYQPQSNAMALVGFVIAILDRHQHSGVIDHEVVWNRASAAEIQDGDLSWGKKIVSVLWIGVQLSQMEQGIDEAIVKFLGHTVSNGLRIGMGHFVRVAFHIFHGEDSFGAKLWINRGDSDGRKFLFDGILKKNHLAHFSEVVAFII